MDTFVHSISRQNYEINNMARFKPIFCPIESSSLFAKQRFMDQYSGYRKFIQNAPASFREVGIVYPNISIHERLRMGNYSCNLHVSHSIPKILWGNSYKDPANKDKETVLDLLVVRLKDMSVTLSKDTLRYSMLQTLHYSKNILFPTLEEARIFLKRMSNASLGKWYENNVKTYSFDGRSVRFHTSIFEIIFYLKYADVMQKGSRSIDRQKTLQEIQIAKEFQKSGKIPPVIRMEIRFTGTRSISSHMKVATGIDKQYWTFDEAFDTELSNKVLKYYWEQIINDRLNYYVLCKSTDEDLCRRVQEELKGEKSKNVDEAMGLYFRLKTLGVKGLKDDIATRHSHPTYKRKMDMMINFVERFVKQDDKLIKVVSDSLDGEIYVRTENLREQLGLSL